MNDEVDIEARREADAAFEEMLASSLRTFADTNKDLVRKAYVLAYEAHQGTRRKSGEPYIMHPIAVARIVAHEVGLGYKSVAAALLHDVVEDTEYTVEDLEGMFGDRIAFLVDGLTKFDNIFDKNVSRQAENFRKMVLAMSNDIRVVLIKLADRLHNMRTLASMAPHKQEKIASETIYLYAPLAHRLGLYNIKTELENLTLKFQSPKVYEELQEKIAQTSAEREAYIQLFCAPLQQRLRDNHFEFEMSGRMKSVYSIWKKMETKQIPFEEIYDLFAVRVVFKPTESVDEKVQCWQIFSLITTTYQPKQERLRNWLSAPKANGYEALHITVMGPKGRWVEVQIRSERMNEIAERGYAAHWRYKEVHHDDSTTPPSDNQLDAMLDHWLGRIREMLANSEENATEFLDQLKLNLFATDMSVYTPKGKLIKLPQKATVIDFAYEIHTAIGSKALGAKVNHKMMPLNHVLRNGDQVEVITADNQHPQTEWLEFATTSRARNAIKDSLKVERREQSSKGKQLVENAILRHGSHPNAMLYKRLLEAYHLTHKQELFRLVGADLLQLDLLDKVLSRSLQRRPKFWRYLELQLFGPGKRKKSDNAQSPATSESETEPTAMTIDKRAFLLKEGTDPSKLVYSIATCCSPIPGDSVIGFIESGDKVVIHKKSCTTALREASQHGEKIVNVKWTEHKMLYLARIIVSGIDRVGMLRDIVHIISENMAMNIRHLNAESHDGLFEDEFDIYVHNTTDLSNLIGKLQKIDGVKEVKRLSV
jgi:GTP pyrophosphokinase